MNAPHWTVTTLSRRTKLQKTGTQTGFVLYVQQINRLSVDRIFSRFFNNLKILYLIILQHFNKNSRCETIGNIKKNPIFEIFRLSVEYIFVIFPNLFGGEFRFEGNRQTHAWKPRIGSVYQ